MYTCSHEKGTAANDVKRPPKQALDKTNSYLLWIGTPVAARWVYFRGLIFNATGIISIDIFVYCVTASDYGWSVCCERNKCMLKASMRNYDNEGGFTLNSLGILNSCF